MAAEDLSPGLLDALDALAERGGWVPVETWREENGTRDVSELERRKLIRYGDLAQQRDYEMPPRVHVRITTAGQLVLDPSHDPFALMRSLGRGANLIASRSS
jgi:hypothetical protein